MASYKDLVGTTVYDVDNNKIGTLSDFYVDGNSGNPTWITVKTGLFGTKSSFVPLAQSKEIDDGLQLAVTKDEVNDAPRVEPDEEINNGEEGELYSYYKGLIGAHGDDTSIEDTATDTGTDTSGPSTDDAMTRSEEELQVNKENRETSTVRMKKYIVTEDVHFTVPVQREEVRMVREPITADNIGDAVDGPDLSEEQHEMTLHAEEVVVGKQVVPKERIRMDKQVVEDQQEVNETVRKEQVDLDDDRSDR